MGFVGGFLFITLGIPLALLVLCTLLIAPIYTGYVLTCALIWFISRLLSDSIWGDDRKASPNFFIQDVEFAALSGVGKVIAICGVIVGFAAVVALYLWIVMRVRGRNASEKQTSKATGKKVDVYPRPMPVRRIKATKSDRLPTFRPGKRINADAEAPYDWERWISQVRDNGQQIYLAHRQLRRSDQGAPIALEDSRLVVIKELHQLAEEQKKIDQLRSYARWYDQQVTQFDACPLWRDRWLRKPERLYSWTCPDDLRALEQHLLQNPPQGVKERDRAVKEANAYSNELRLNLDALTAAVRNVQRRACFEFLSSDEIVAVVTEVCAREDAISYSEASAFLRYLAHDRKIRREQRRVEKEMRSKQLVNEAKQTARSLQITIDRKQVQLDDLAAQIRLLGRQQMRRRMRREELLEKQSELQLKVKSYKIDFSERTRINRQLQKILETLAELNNKDAKLERLEKEHSALQRQIEDLETQAFAAATRANGQRSSRSSPRLKFVQTSHDFEKFMATWMIWAGWVDAKVMPVGPDGGIDVKATGALGQAKYWDFPVGIEEVQRHYGVCDGIPKDGRLFLSKNGYTPQAVSWADQVNMPLLMMKAESNGQAKVAPASRAAKELCD